MSTILQVRKDGSLLIPAEVLGRPEPETEYVVESTGTEIILHPESNEAAGGNANRAEWTRLWRELGKQIDREWKTDKSAAEVISEIRR